ncbi:oxidoreductase [Streptomyces camponoticapitis]|uniref:Oxidoreductase n=1 Tax=Streptomyces camponoticapitis TaxID=1616125 RepID=A0ABQ2E1T1_9ACTN|nr:aldo/keto reductase [Streptomyces camponoticapitis]GGJ84813.1 oxidoreductase [Streptomyces camponoticapitis]
MKQRTLGRTGLRVSELCLGTMTFVKDDEAGAHRILDTFTEAGGTFLDTADAYGQGVSEEVLGGWLKGQDRDGLVIATKVALPMGEGPNKSGLGRKHIIASVEASLRRLGTDYIDLYQTHVWDVRTPIEETLGTLDTLVKAGKVRYLGASNVSPGQLQRALDVADRRGWEPYVCLQPIYNLLAREVEWELLPQSEAAGVGVIPYSPLQGGWLTGKYQRGMTSVPAGSRESHGDGESWRARDNEETWRVVETVQAVATETERTPSQVALRWLLGRPGVTAPIIGARTLDQLKDNLGAVGWELTADQTTRLDEASQRPLPYPYSVLSHFS